MGLLDGKVAIITGASKGIGRALSLCFAREGAAVVCAARSADLVKETAQMVQRAGGRAIAVTCDAAVEGDVKRMVGAGAQAFGRITTLVNNAGDGGPTKPVEDYTMDDWLYTIHSCLTSSYVCTRFSVPEMIKAGSGSIDQHLLGGWSPGVALPHRVLLCEGGPGRHDVRHGARARTAGHPRELRRPRRRRGRSHRPRHRRPGRGARHHPRVDAPRHAQRSRSSG